MRRSNRRSPRSLGQLMLPRHHLVRSPGHLKGHPDRSGCSSSVEAAAPQGRKVEPRLMAPCYYHIAEGNNNLAEGPSSGRADCSRPAEAEAGVEAA